MTLSELLHTFLHLNDYLAVWFSAYGAWLYAFIFLLVFAETGCVILPFLPGDSLLFALGAFLATQATSPFWLVCLLILAAFLGDNLNYTLGRHFGDFALRHRWIKPRYLTQTQVFYEQHGRLALILARFMPIIRTLAPFVAGLGKMSYLQFLKISFCAAGLWIVSLLYLGYAFGQLDFVKHYFSTVIAGIVMLSLLPIFHNLWAQYCAPKT